MFQIADTSAIPYLRQRVERVMKDSMMQMPT
jgi:hypothetical protein